METYREKKTGSVRLNEEQYLEMERLGIENESAYVNFKLNHPQLKVVDDNEPAELEGHVNADVKVMLALQKAEMENLLLKERLDEMSKSKEEALNGISTDVSKLLQEELMKRDFEALKKENAQQLKEIDRLEAQLKKSDALVDEKSNEIGELVKKLGFVEVGKALLPSAVSGLAKHYPKQLNGLVATLGELGGDMAPLPGHQEIGVSEEQKHLLTIAEYLTGLFSEEQFQQFLMLAEQLNHLLKFEENAFEKLSYYLNRLERVGQNKPQSEQEISKGNANQKLEENA